MHAIWKKLFIPENSFAAVPRWGSLKRSPDPLANAKPGFATPNPESHPRS